MPLPTPSGHTFDSSLVSYFVILHPLLRHQHKIAYFLSPRYLAQQVNDLMFIIDLIDCSKNTTLDAPVSPTVQNFSSPYFPTHTFRNKTCGWNIVAPEGHSVQVHVKSEKSKWGVKVFDVDGSDFTAIRIHWNFFTDTGTVFSKFQKVYISWISDPTIAADGIFVSYTAIRIRK